MLFIGKLEYNKEHIILMLNSNRQMRQSLQRSKRIQKNPHTASIILKPQDSYSDTLYIPLNKLPQQSSSGLGSYMNPATKRSKKLLDRSVRLDKSPNPKLQREKENKFDIGVLKPDYKLKMSNHQLHGRIETDRKELRKSMDKALKTIRLRTDYNDILDARAKDCCISNNKDCNSIGKDAKDTSKDCISTSKDCLTSKDCSISGSKHTYGQVSTKNTEDYVNSNGSKIVLMPKSQMMKLYQLHQKLLQENIALKREIGFVGRASTNNSVLKALNL